MKEEEDTPVEAAEAPLSKPVPWQGVGVSTIGGGGGEGVGGGEEEDGSSQDFTAGGSKHYKHPSFWGWRGLRG